MLLLNYLHTQVFRGPAAAYPGKALASFLAPEICGVEGSGPGNCHRFVSKKDINWASCLSLIIKAVTFLTFFLSKENHLAGINATLHFTSDAREYVTITSYI